MAIWSGTFCCSSDQASLAFKCGPMGKIIIVKEYLLVKRTQYEKLGNPMALTLDLKSVPLEVYEARNAVEIARSRGADKYSPEIFSKAEAGLQLTEAALARKKDRKEIISTARMAAQSSEDARALAAQHRGGAHCTGQSRSSREGQGRGRGEGRRRSGRGEAPLR